MAIIEQAYMELTKDLDILAEINSFYQDILHPAIRVHGSSCNQNGNQLPFFYLWFYYL